MMLCEICGKSGHIYEGWYSALELIKATIGSSKLDMLKSVSLPFDINALTEETFFCDKCSHSMKEMLSLCSNIGNVGATLSERKVIL